MYKKLMKKGFTSDEILNLSISALDDAEAEWKSIS